MRPNRFHTFLMLATAGTLCVVSTHGLRAQNPSSNVSAQSSSAAPLTAPEVQAVLGQYCVGCHNEKLKTGGLALDMVDLTQVSARADMWEKVVRKLRMGLMPPAGSPRLDQAHSEAVVSWLESEIDRAAVRQPNPGRTAAFHRLNRTEYHNVIRDLLALDVDVTALLPVEPSTFGLDNIADVLSISPTLMSQYTSAARKISRLAVGLKSPNPVMQTYRVPTTVNQEVRVSDDLPFGSRGGLAFRHYFPRDGEYELTVSLKRDGFEYILGLEEPHQLDIRLDGTRVQRFAVGGESKGKAAPLTFGGWIGGDPEWEQYYHSADKGLIVRFVVKAGPHQVSASFIETLSEPDGVMSRGIRARQPGRATNVTVAPLLQQPEVASVAIAGPSNDVSAGDTPSRRKIFVCRPNRASEETACAETIVARLARQAFRRPVPKTEVQSLLDFYRTGRAEGSFDDGIQFALERLLASPSFLFRVERDPSTAKPNTPYEISDLELASRLSFFLWSSAPDEALLSLAVKGGLNTPNTLEREARRLLADPRSAALVESFFTQWLDVRTLPTHQPDGGAFPSFDDNLRTAFQREIEFFLKSQIAEDRSVTELLTSKETFLNERLAQHYGIANVFGSEFRRVTLADETRFGLLGKGGILTATSYPNRTSPVLRGKWVIANLLGSPPPDPPPNVPGLKDAGPEGKPASVRERLEQHRKNPVCANCHAQFDPLGLVLENFDATGRWRSQDAGSSIDASASMPGTSAIQGPVGLRQFLVSHREEVVSAATEKLLAYALGRVTVYTDQPVIRQIVSEARADDYRWSSILVGIVKSTPFRMRMPSSAPGIPSQEAQGVRPVKTVSVR